MPLAPQLPDDRPSEASLPLDRFVEPFERAWQGGRPPALEEYLPPEAGLRPAVLAELVQVDLEYRLKAGEAARVEDYLGRFPELTQNRRLVLRLLAAEHDLRRRRQAPPSLKEYLERFPQYAEDLLACGQLLPTGREPTPRRVSCPHCRGPVDLGAGAAEATCRACGSTFSPDRGGPAAGAPAGQSRQGKYELLEVIGRGAFGVVYRGRDTELGRLVAVKVPRAGTLTAPEEVDRFLREARSAAQLKHPGIVTLYDAERIGGTCLLVSELVQGMSLADRLQAGPPPPAEAARLLAAVADALQYAHGRGVVHRDVKPSNILLDQDGAPHLADFGLARRDAGEATVTLEGQVLGTPAYMSPEQAAGAAHTADGRSDVYSLGVVLYQLLIGELPFRGTTRMLLHQVLHDEPRPPRRLNDRIPRDLETVCLKAMSKEPAGRYRTAGELADDLRRFLKGEPVRARPVGRGERLRRWCRRNPALAAACGLAALSLAAAAAVAGAFGVYQSYAAGRLSDALGGSEERRCQLAQANTDLEETDKRRREGLRLSAGLALGQGLTFCDQDEAARGLLWLARGLEIAPDEEADLQQVLRTNLAAWRRRVHPLRAAFPFPDPVVAEVVVFSPDGRTVLTGTKKGTARLWEVATGELIGQPLRHQGDIRGAAFSPDGKVVVTCAMDNTARLWEADTGQSRGEPMRHDDVVWTAAFSPDGKTILTGSADKTARLWDAGTGKLLLTLTGHEHNVSSVAFSPDGKTVATGGEDRTVRLWEAATGRPIGQALRHEGMVSAVCFSPDGRLVATGAFDDTARLWKADTGDPLGPPLRHHRQVMALAFSPDGKLLVTASGDKTARLWETSTGHHVGRLMRHEGWVLAVAFSPDGKTVLTGSEDQTARLWDAATAEQRGAPLPSRGPVTTVAFSPDGKKALTAGEDQTLRVWDLADAEPTGTVLRHDDRVWAAVFSRDGRTVLTGSEDRTARRWDAATGRPLGSPLPHPFSVRFVDFSTDGEAIVTVTVDGTVRRWQPDTGQVRDTFRMPPDVEGGLVGTRDGTLFLASSRGDGGGVRLWRASTGRPVGEPLPHPAPVWAKAFSPDGKTALTGCGAPDQATGQARLWDVATGQPRGTPWPHPGEVTAVAFSPDGETVLTGCADWDCRLWDVATGRPLGKPLRHGAEVYAAAFSPDGRTVVTGCHDGHVQLWDVTTRKPLGPPFRHQDEVWSSAFSPDGKTILTGSRDGTARLWPVPGPLSGEAERLVTWTQVLTGMELDASGAVQVMDAPTWRERRRLDELGGPP